MKPEIEEGNIEYKRYFKDVNKKRLFELITQMNWRLIEGDGICYYYLSVNDDGSIYKEFSKKDFKYSIEIIKTICIECNAKISKIDTKYENNNKYYVVEIKKKYIDKKYKEFRILLLGDTGTLKTTFLANLIKGKSEKEYIVNHKHELESGKTSSINYYTIEYNNDRYLFFDSPGKNDYIKTLLKMIQSIDYNLVIFFSDKEWEYYNMYYDYFSIINTKIVNINNIITDELKLNINKDSFMNKIKEEIIYKENNNNFIKFNILQTFYNNEIGILLSGFLQSGRININDKLYWYNDKRYEVIILSIHDCNSQDNNNISREYICGPCIATLCIKIIDNFSKIKYGFISNKEYHEINRLKIHWFNDNIPKNNLLCNIDNSKIVLDKNNIIINNYKLRNNVINKIIICYNLKMIGLIY